MPERKHAKTLCGGILIVGCLLWGTLPPAAAADHVDAAAAGNNALNQPSRTTSAVDAPPGMSSSQEAGGARPAARAFPATRWEEDFTKDQRAKMLAMEVFLAVWFFALGSVIGSFLNVVIYRLPAGKNLIHPPSHCPFCRTPIRPTDNIPVFGWLRLRGRCRSCGVKIARRYPIVEAICGGFFLVLLYRVLFAGGANLPLQPPPPFGSSRWVSWFADFRLLTIYFAHCLFLCTLLAMALITFDGHRIPRRLFAFGVVIGLLLSLFCPQYPPIPLWPEMPASWHQLQWNLPALEPFFGPALRLRVDDLLTACAGLCLGAIFGRIVGMGRRRLRATNGATGNEASFFATVGLFLGWQFALVSATLCQIVGAARRLLTGMTRRAFSGRADWLVTGFIIVTAQLFSWQSLDALPWWLGSQSSGATAAGWAAVFCLLAGIFELLPRPRITPVAPTPPALTDEEVESDTDPETPADPTSTEIERSL